MQTLLITLGEITAAINCHNSGKYSEATHTLLQGFLAVRYVSSSNFIKCRQHGVASQKHSRNIPEIQEPASA